MIWLVVIKSITLLVDHQHASVIQIARWDFRWEFIFLIFFSVLNMLNLVWSCLVLMSVHVYVVYCSSFGSMFRFMRLIDRTSFAATQNIFQNFKKIKWNVFLGAGFFLFSSNKNLVVSFDNNLDIKFSQSCIKQTHA